MGGGLCEARGGGLGDGGQAGAVGTQVNSTYI